MRTYTYSADDGAQLHCLHWQAEEGSVGTVVMLPSLFFGAGMFDSVAGCFSGDYDVIAPDHRGQGSSAAAGRLSDPSIERLARDTIALITGLDRGPVHLVGSSMGGYIALQVAAWRPDLLRTLALSCCTSHAERQPERFTALEQALRERGPAKLVDALMATMFGEPFMREGDATERERWYGHFAALPNSVADAVHGVFARHGYESLLPALSLPLLLMSGEHDRAKRPDDMAYIAEHVPGSRHLVFARSGHTPPVEEPSSYARALLRFWCEHDGVARRRIEQVAP